MINKLTFIFFIVVYTNCKSQNIDTDIIGRWDSITKEVDGIEDFRTLDGGKPVADMSIIIYEAKLDLIESGIPYKDIPYQIVKKDQKYMLAFGNRRYYIEKLDSDNLVLLTDSSILPIRYSMKKNNR